MTDDNNGEIPAAIVEAVRALAEYEASMAAYVSLAQEHPTPRSLRRFREERAGLAGDRRRVRRELREMLADFTGALRAHGVPPERMVIAVKTIAERALGRSNTLLAATLRSDLMLWAIETYYAGAPGGSEGV